MINITLCFSNSETCLKLINLDPLKVSELKTLLLDQHWPESQIDKSKIEKIRMFSMGYELQDFISLSQLRTRNIDYPIPILVHIIKQSPQSPADDQSCCSCLLL